MSQNHLPWRPIVVLLVLSLLWGGEFAMIKIGLRGVAPIFMAAIRSLVASLCLFVWMHVRGIPFFPESRFFWHGLTIGVVFAIEFICMFLGINYTLASRSYVLVYTAPFFVALGAHFFLHGDRFTLWKIIGLLIAFLGVILLFARDAGGWTRHTLPGDLLLLSAAALWGSNTLYVKRFLADKVLPLQTLFYLMAFSTLPLFLFSIALEDRIWFGFSLAVGFSLFYQSILVAFLSYLIWFELIRRYPVSLISSFTFFTPVFGVFLSGLLIMGEVIRPALILSLALVSLGIILVNRPPSLSPPQMSQ